MQARNHCSNHCCCGLRNNASDVRQRQAHKLDLSLLLCFAGCLVLARAGVCIICCWQKSRNFENTIFLEKKDPLHPLPSVHVAEERVLSSPVPRLQLMSDASRLWSFGGRPSDIPNFLGLDNPAVTGCQVGSILETPPNCVCQVWYER